MKITIEHDNGKKEVFQHISDAYLCVRQLEPMQGKKGAVAVLPETKSYSWGSNIREIAKELAVASAEMNAWQGSIFIRSMREIIDTTNADSK